MKCRAEITAYSSGKGLAEVLEGAALEGRRSRISVRRGRGCTIVAAEAADSVALRASLTGITQVMTVWERAQEVCSIASAKGSTKGRKSQHEKTT